MPEPIEHKFLQAARETIAYLQGQADAATMAALNGVARRLAAMVRRIGQVTPDDAAATAQAWQLETERHIAPVLEHAWRMGTLGATAQLGLPSAPTLTSATEAYLAQARNRITNFGDDLWEIVRQQFIDGIAAGDSIPELAARIHQLPGLVGPRATTVARTEIISASNAGSLATATASGVVARKVWLATEDDRTRPSHRAADGQTVDLHENFTVGGWPANAPGDPALPPEQSVNCRCALTWETAEAFALAAATEVEPVVNGVHNRRPYPADSKETGSETVGSEARSSELERIRYMHHASMRQPPMRERRTLPDRDTGRQSARRGDERAAGWIDPQTGISAQVRQARRKQGDRDHPAEKPWLDANADSTAIRSGTVASKQGREGHTLEARREELAMSPWHKVPNSAECPDDKPWAVVQDDSGEVVGCHANEADADAQLAALYANEPEAAEQLATLVEGPTWEGVLTLEGVESGDGREFAPDSLVWERLPLPLEWQKETTHGGDHDLTVLVGNITAIERRGKELWGTGQIDMQSADGMEASRLVGQGLLRWVSVNVDSVKDADVELVFPEGGDEDDGLFGPAPDKAVFHKGRIRGATLVNTAAFIEAEISLVGADAHASTTTNEAPVVVSGNAAAGALSFGAIGSHSTGTSDGSWDGPANEARLPSPLTLEQIRAAYAWYDPTMKDDDGKFPKAAARFIHHEISSDGRAGAANLTACSTGIGVLNGGRGGTTIPAADRQGIWNHLSAHLRAADREVPELLGGDTIIAAGGHSFTLPDRPPKWWFNEPTDVSIHGALTITDEGRLYGYLAPGNVGHISPMFRGRTVPLGTDYSRFHRVEAICEGGERITCGVVTMGCNHAPKTASPVEVEQFENTCSVFGKVRVGENKHGVWVAGYVLPDVTADQVERAMSCSLSGYWRDKDDRSGTELFSALLVPVPGFPMSRQTASVRMRNGALVASAIPVEFASGCGCGGHNEPLKITAQQIEAVHIFAAEQRRQEADRMAAMVLNRKEP